MFNFFNIISFSNYYALFSLALIPIIWIIIKSFPPAHKSYNFSSFFLLEKINYSSSKNKKTPLWLLIFRIVFFILIVLFFSKPFLKDNNSSTNEQYEKYVIIADTGWSMAKDWNKFKNIVLEISKEAEQSKKSLTFIHTNIQNFQSKKVFQKSDTFKNYLETLSPLPIQFDQSNLEKIVKEDRFVKNSKVFLLSSAFDFYDFSNMLETFNLIKNNSNKYHFINPVDNILIIKNVKINSDKIVCEINRLGNTNLKQTFFFNVKTINNEVIYNSSHTIDRDKSNEIINLTFPIEIINQIKSINIVGQNHAGAKYFFDDFAKKKKIAILTDNNAYKESPLLSPTYYIKKSLDPKHSIKISKIYKILKENFSTIIIPENLIINDDINKKLKEWLLNGGTLIRFASENLVQESFNYLPFEDTSSRIRYIEGQLTINNKLYISSFKKNSIFYGLKVPQDITITKQMVFNTNSDQVNILAKLNDNTPLVSMKKFGEGEIIFFHVGANNSWSNLPISSLFSDMINRLLLFSKNYQSSNLKNLNLNKEIDGFGNLKFPKKTVPIKSFDKFMNVKPSLTTPPGQYENNEISMILNLSTNININKNVENSSNILSSYSFKNTKDLTSIILKIVVLMFILDTLLTVLIKNNINIFKIFSKASNFLFLLLFFSLIKIDNISSNDTYLAYIKIKNNQINNIVANGLETLKGLLSKRTSIMPKGVIGLDIRRDEIFSYPFIYWPLTKNLLSIEQTEINKINNYLDNGGIFLFDITGFSRDSFDLKDEKFNEIRKFLSTLEVNNLSIIPKEHTLTKSFYLLDKFPGKWDNKILFIENSNLEYKDGVSSIILGFNNWAEAWALDKNETPLFPVVPGGERQRELAYRFGINITMYALTGNYKSDQIHSKSILKRLSDPY